MSQGTIDDTLQKIQKLTPEPHQPALAPQAQEAAEEFLSQIRETLASAGGPPWQTPTAEVGGGGSVVLLWEEGQRILSLTVGPDGATRWFYEPGAPFGSMMGVPATLNQLNGGPATPDEFARRLWPAWVRGDDLTASDA
jgi:hypothetical protein